jgi:membrane-associated protease RseP (regulator of RpoE activity)
VWAIVGTQLLGGIVFFRLLGSLRESERSERESPAWNRYATAFIVLLVPTILLIGVASEKIMSWVSLTVFPVVW